jgi:hypothetical protein
VTFNEELLTRNSKSRFKGLFICDGPKIIKVNEDRRTDDKDGHGTIKREGSLNNMQRSSSGSIQQKPSLRMSSTYNMRAEAQFDLTFCRFEEIRT